MGKLISPNKMYEKGVELMLKGVDPISASDWNRLVHFWAYNLDSSKLPHSLKLLCTVFHVPITDTVIETISGHYHLEALKRQEEMLKKIIGKPVQHQHLKHLRSIMSQNLNYDQLIEVFTKAEIEISWPHHDAWEKLGKLCKALFLLPGSGFAEAQKKMSEIINAEVK